MERMVPLRGGEWAEIRTLAIGEVPGCPAEKDPLPQIHVRELSYFSRLTDAATFTDLAEAETRRRNLVHTKEVCAVMMELIGCNRWWISIVRMRCVFWIFPTELHISAHCLRL